MSSYVPISLNENSGATDRVVSIEKVPFVSAPPLSFLNSYEETITANPVYYDPFKPELSNVTSVTYTISRAINVLSDRTVALRHNGRTVDMEIFVDNYRYIPKEPIVALYSPAPVLPKIREGDFYNRSTTAYIYKDVDVPRASNKIWDGRYSRCVDLNGYDVSNHDRLPEVLAEVASKLDNATQLYMVMPVAGMATTVSPPKKDPYAATYRVKIQQFIALHYNSIALTRHPKGQAETDLYQELPQEDGDKKFKLQERFVAAVLDGPYFVKWANVYRYVDTAPDPDDDCGHKIIEYDQDGDAVIVLGHMCGMEPPPVPPEEDDPAVDTAITKLNNNYLIYCAPQEITTTPSVTGNIVIPYVSGSEYIYQFFINVPETDGDRIVAVIVLNGIPAGVYVYIDEYAYPANGLMYEFEVSNPPEYLTFKFKGDIIPPAIIEVEITYLSVVCTPQCFTRSIGFSDPLSAEWDIYKAYTEGVYTGATYDVDTSGGYWRATLTYGGNPEGYAANIIWYNGWAYTPSHPDEIITLIFSAEVRLVETNATGGSFPFKLSAVQNNVEVGSVILEVSGASNWTLRTGSGGVTLPTTPGSPIKFYLQRYNSDSGPTGAYFETITDHRNAQLTINIGCDIDTNNPDFDCNGVNSGTHLFGTYVSMGGAGELGSYETYYCNGGCGVVFYWRTVNPIPDYVDGDAIDLVVDGDFWYAKHKSILYGVDFIYSWNYSALDTNCNRGYPAGPFSPHGNGIKYRPIEWGCEPSQGNASTAVGDNLVITDIISY